MSAKKVYFDALRSLAFGSISGSYAALGSALTVRPRIASFSNSTNANLIVSTDNTISAGTIYIPAGSSKMFNFTSNMIPGQDDAFEMAVGSQFYAKDTGTAATSGALTLEIVYAD